MIHTQNECITARDLPFLGWSCLQAKIDELWHQTQVAMALLYANVCNYMHNSKTKGGMRMFYLSNDCSTMGDVYSLG